MNNSFPTSQHRNKQLYHAYLLRLWCSEQVDTTCWRASLEDCHTGERIGFASLEQLFAFLMERGEPSNTVCPTFLTNHEIPK